MTAEAPEITGCAPDAACHTTGCPALPESADVKLQVLDGRYVPSANSTVTSAVLSAAVLVRTTLCAPDREHGAVAEQTDPVPDGEA
ncbi:hypothetical protein [Kitasatospora sp. NPDC057015]|uniref:hypothetical protein n=1 Tax=Kitasatospora sp. NPDC057015 TaxID=3346001 RepID=UPI003624D592